MNLSSIYLVLAQASPAQEAHEQQLLDIDGTVFIQLGLFLLTMLVLSKLLWKPYLRVRGERSTRIDGYKEEAKRLDADAATRLAKVDAELAQARREGSAERARGRVETALAAERSSLASRAELLGRQAAEKVLGRKVA